MIIEVNPQLFHSEDTRVLEKLGDLTKCFLDGKFIWEPLNLFDVFYDESGNIIDSEFTRNFLTAHSRQKLLDTIEVLIDSSAYITDTHRHYLKAALIGNLEGELNIDDALKIINNPSKVIVENATNDWKFIKGLVKKYSKHNTRKSIYSLLQKAVENNQIIAENAGGKGQIIGRYNDLSSGIYRGIAGYKIATFFDSDRLNETSINHEQKLIVEFFKNGQAVSSIDDAKYETSDKIFWHLFYKRELENYLHKEILKENLTLTEPEIQTIDLLNPQTHDFLDFETQLSTNSNINVKTDFPNLFLVEWTRDKIEARCSHHFVQISLPNGIEESVSEIEYLLLNLASII